MTDLTRVLSFNRAEYARIIPFEPEKDKLLPLDFTSGNNELTDDLLNDTRLFCDYINHKLQNNNARYGIGGYAENRTVYRTLKLFSPNASSASGKLDEAFEPRCLHLGIDIWGKPHTAVHAPMDAIVHSFAYNDKPGDYGPTIILTHQLQGLSFYTLYGHLTLSSIKNLSEGDRIWKDDIFAEFGSPNENGQWPPHLHFQVISDLQGWSGDYPGVCTYSESESYLANSPDPDLILQMMQYANK